jgi:acetyl esterase/lipase
MRYAKSILSAAIASLALAAPAIADSVSPPAGAAPLRYRDVIFPTLTATPGLTYGSAPDGSGNPVTLTLDMYRPSGDTQTTRPAIVLVHGGSFTGGNSKNGAMVTMAKGFAERGYVAVSINYRLLGQKGENCGTEPEPSQTCVTGALAAQHDTQAAIRWLRRYAATYGVDPTRIAVGGGSAGAATALAVAVNSGDPGSSGNPGYSSKVGAAVSISGALPGSFAKTLYDRSDSPIVMFEGTADTVVPYTVASQTAADLRAAGIRVAFEALPGGGHVPMATFGDQIVNQSAYFAYDYLNLARAAGQPTVSPSATITQPRSGGSYSVGQVVKTSFSCAEGRGGPGLASCRDSAGAASGSGKLDTREPGTHTYRVTAVSSDGLQRTATISYEVKPPELSRLSVSPRRFRAATHGPAIAHRGGLKISYRDSLAARTTFEVLGRTTGVKHGRRCLAVPRGRHPARRSRCTRLIALGSFSHEDRSGTSTLRFSGRLRYALAPGSYLLKATPSWHGHKGRPVTVAFQILGRQP